MSKLLRTMVLVVVSVIVITAIYFLFALAPAYLNLYYPLPQAPVVSGSAIIKQIRVWLGIIGCIVLIPLFYGIEWGLKRLLPRTPAILVSALIPALLFFPYLGFVGEHTEGITVAFGLVNFVFSALVFYLTLLLELMTILYAWLFAPRGDSQ